MSLTIALAVAPTTNATLSAALSTEIGETQPIAITQQTAVEAHELSATAINEAWAGVDAASQAALLGTASDATLAALPQLHREQTGKGFLLASKLDAEAAAFVGTLLNCVGSSAAIGMQSDPLSVAETAAELRNCSSADALKAISALPETVLGAVSRAFGAQGSNGLISHLHKLLGSSGQLRALLQARIERAAALPEAAGKGGGGHSHPSAARAARRLHAAGKGLFCGTDEDTFIEVLGFASPSFAAAIRYEYAMRFGHTLASAVRDEMRGDLQALLLAFLQKTHDDDANAAAATTLAESRARALWAASEGAGYDGAAWARIFGEVTCSQLAELMRIMQRHGLPLPALIRDEFYGDAKELLLVRCRWAASEARRRTAAAKALPLTLPTPPPGRITIGENFPFKAVDSAALSAWAALIATTAASSMGRLLSAYSTVDGSAAVDLSADLHALVTSDDEQYVAVRDLLFALLCRPPLPFAARESSRSLPPPVSSATTSPPQTEGGGASKPPSEGADAKGGPIASGDRIDDCPSSRMYYDDGPADTSLAESHADELLYIVPWRVLLVSAPLTAALKSPRGGGSAAPLTSAIDSTTRDKAERALLTLIGASSFSHIAAVEFSLARRLAIELSSAPTNPSTARFYVTPSNKGSNNPMLQVTGPGSHGALLLWASCTQLHPICKLILEQRYAKAMAPAIERAERIKSISKLRLFGRNTQYHERAIGELVCSAPSHEWPLLCRYLSLIDPNNDHDAASGMIRSSLQDGPMRDLILGMLRPKSEGRPDPLQLAETCAEELRSSMKKQQLLRAFVNYSDAQLYFLASALDTQQPNNKKNQPVLEELARELAPDDDVRTLLLTRCNRIRSDAANGASSSSTNVSTWSLAGEQAQALYRAGKGSCFRSDRRSLCKVLSCISPEQASAIRYEYSMRYGQTLASALRKELAGESDLELLLLALIASPLEASLIASIGDTSVKAQSESLLEALKGDPNATCGDAQMIIRVMTGLSAAKLHEVSKLYERQAREPLSTSIQMYAPAELVDPLLARLEWANQVGGGDGGKRRDEDEPRFVSRGAAVTLAAGLPPPPPPPVLPAATTPTADKAEAKSPAAVASELLLSALPNLGALKPSARKAAGVEKDGGHLTLIPDAEAATRLVRLLCDSGEAQLSDLRTAYRERTGYGLTDLIKSSEILNATVPASTIQLLSAMVTHPPPSPLQPVDLAEMVADLLTCDAQMALEILTANAPPRMVEALVGSYSRMHGRDASEDLRVRHFKTSVKSRSTNYEQSVAVTTMLRRAALAVSDGTATKSGTSAAARFSDPLAVKAARRLHAAGKGLFCGTDQDSFIEVLGLASPSFAAAIRYEYAMRFGHTLASAVRDEMRGDLQALLLAFLKPPPSVASSIADAKLAQQQASDLHEAAKGMGTHTKPFIQIFGSVSHAQLNAVLRAYEAQFGRPLVEMLREEFVFDLNVRKLCVTRCKWAAKGADESAITPRSPSTQTAERRVSIGLRGHLTVTSPQKDPAEAFQLVSLDSLPPSRPGQLLLVRVESHDPAVLKRLAALQSSSPDAVVKAVEIPKRLLPPPAATTTTAVKSPVTPSPITPASTAVLSPRGVNVAAASAARTPTKPLITPVLSPAIMSLNKSSVTAAATLARTVASTPPLRDSSNSQPPPSRPTPAAQTPTKPAATAVTRPAVRTPLNSSNQPQQPVARGAVAATVARPPSPVRPPSPLGVFSATAPATTSDWPSLRQDPPLLL